MNTAATPLATARTALFLPATRLERLPKALASGADLVILDLEDAVAQSDKPAARAALADAARHWSAAQCERLCVRINALDTAAAAEDLALLAELPMRAVMLPKVQDPDGLRALPATHGAIALIETARGLAAAPTLGQAPMLQRLAFGSIDYALDLGGLDPQDREALRHARSQLVWASRCAGLSAPLDGVTARLDDEAELQADLHEARRLGFGGKLCIHPQQVTSVHRGFAPSAEELAWARRVMAVAADGAAARLDGAMVDRPVVLRAQRLLAAAA